MDLSHIGYKIVVRANIERSIKENWLR